MSIPSEELGYSLALGICPESLVSQIPGHWHLCHGVKALGEDPWWTGQGQEQAKGLTFLAGFSRHSSSIVMDLTH